MADTFNIDLFVAEERQILAYADVVGGKRIKRYADPMQVEAAWNLASVREGRDMGEIFKTLARIPNGGEEPDPGTVAAVAEAVAALGPIAHAAFGTKPFDPETGDGLTAADYMGNVHAFLEFQASVKKNIAASPGTSTPITVGPPDAGPTG